MKSQHDINRQQYKNNSVSYLNSEAHSQGIEFQKMRDVLQSIPSAQVLDLGCGAGHVSYQVANFAESVIAYDLSDEMVALVDKTAQSKNLHNISVCQGAAEALPFLDQSFDVVISRYSAHHWQDISMAFKEVYRVLKPQGMVIFVDILGCENAVLDTFLQAIELIRDPSHVKNYDLSEWTEFCGKHQFKVLRFDQQSLDLNFKAWVERMQVVPEQIKTILFLQQQANDMVRRFFALQEDGSFTSSVGFLVAQKY